ncbi:S-adenosyl-L-methionine-dependent methyltransferase [Mycena pura]|uniref:tRNA (guanine(10)-N(2))-methyltransferase n=1 Tax=Mycena pura TaxID=153505 RepID=A0AAD6YG90_9AGAR|nr:S-adenosyl-L-methionine-dependent methyltransferase [Mycena pura]
MPSYLIVFAQSHSEFRLPELHSVAELHGFKIHIPHTCDLSRPFMVLDLESEEHARLLSRRCILVKHVYEFYAHGKDYDELHAANKANNHLWSSYVHDTSFKFLVTAYNHKILESRQRAIIESFKYMGFLGAIDLKNPQIVLGCFEEYDDSSGLAITRDDRDGRFRQVYFGKLVADGDARALIKLFDVKQRLYYGNTSMESEVSLLMANQALAGPSKLIYDPFCGTGSMAYPVAYFGARVFGSDIDGRQMRGKAGKSELDHNCQDEPPGVLRAAKQYGVADRIVDLCTFDVTRNPWRCGNLFDTIVTDPPYGVRAGAKRLGRKRELTDARKAAKIEYQLSARSGHEPYIPPTKPYELSLLAADLVLLARYLLKPGGRLVFFLPTVNENYEEVDIQSMLCEGMVVVANSLQDFGSWGRRVSTFHRSFSSRLICINKQLVTIRKETHDSYPPPSYEERDSIGHLPAHKDFREQYFRGFKKGS